MVPVVHQSFGAVDSSQSGGQQLVISLYHSRSLLLNLNTSQHPFIFYIKEVPRQTNASIYVIITNALHANECYLQYTCLDSMTDLDFLQFELNMSWCLGSSGVHHRFGCSHLGEKYEK